ncbi:MAG: phage terminase large subunit family protein, partial [Bacteroidetes bacterium]|nr:phage terminase large subunit family protein [Bacteroidota bacterium]
MDTRIKQIFGDCSALIPPARIELDRWLEDNINLPAGVSAVPGRFKLWPFQREICQAITDPTIERVTLVKPVRVGFTTLLTGAVGHFVENDPSPVLCVLPIETDCRSYLADELEPIFEASGININQDLGNRDTMLARRFLGGSLRIIPSRSPGRLRKLTCRILMIDEVDGMEVTREGDPVRLSINRTMTFRNRKIIMGSTPVFLETSAILRAYSNSDRRVFQVPCPSCGIYNQILWKHIVWENRDPSTACYQCPDCNERIDHKHKVTMVTNGVWKARKPEIANHAGFHLNSLVSLLYNTRWEVLVEEFLEAKQDPELLQTFINTILAEGWAGVGEELDVEGLKDGVGDFSLESMPEGILYLTAGVDVQRDRLEVVTIGWDQDRTIHVLDQ